MVDIGLNEDRILKISKQEYMCYYTHLALWYWPESDLILHENELLKVYNLLSDEKSRDIFASRIALFVNGADYQSFQKYISNVSAVRHSEGSNFLDCANSTNYDSESFLQFNNDLIHLDDNEVLIDGGAFNGDSTLEFIKACVKNKVAYRKIICYEPDPKIFVKLRENMRLYSHIVLRSFGLWSHSSTMKFVDSNTVKPGSTRILAAYNNDDLTGGASRITEISTTSIDEDFPDEIATIIKMDIEGAEMKALHGAMKTIARCRPKLIISAYHKRDDLFEIPLLINEIAPDYELYFRHFSSNFGETTLFAIP
ncbi:MAG: FkbM family methyltransferase, partial [Syntrophobacteraceae bacterium]